VLQLDVVFPVLHGTFGEDGTMQGLFELAGLAYVGSGVLGSATGMDKEVMKRLFLAAGLPITSHVTFLRREWEKSPRKTIARLEAALKYPLFVKPANLGSSVGISKAHDRKELGPAIDLAAASIARSWWSRPWAAAVTGQNGQGTRAGSRGAGQR
jgi:D-alanine-D-alanine ligase